MALFECILDIILDIKGIFKGYIILLSLNFVLIKKSDNLIILCKTKLLNC